MVLTATATPKILQHLKAMLSNPFISKGSVNRGNISLHVETMPNKGPTSPTCRGDFSGFARRVKEIIADRCSIIYTDFIVDVGPILESLRMEGIEAVGYYGEMDNISKAESHALWREGRAQVIVATKAFGMGIDEADICHIIRHGVPESLNSWAQELGRAGRDGKPASAHIFYDEKDADNACAWIKDHLRNKAVVDRILKDFSESWRYIYAHAAGICRRRVLQDVFGESSKDASATEICCDACVQ